MTLEVLRYAAFTMGGAGGNPAGVVLEADGLSDAEMQELAREIGYSETAFVESGFVGAGFVGAGFVGAGFVGAGATGCAVRYFAPAREVPFCGHATIAAAVALAERRGIGPLVFRTPVGPVPVQTRLDGEQIEAELTSVAPRIDQPAEGLRDAALEALRWSVDDLDSGYPAAVVDAGARHLMLVSRTRERLADLDYDVDRLRAVMTGADLITVALVWPESATRWHARNPFPVGGVVEDPATGAAAAALGGYLRHLKVLPAESAFEVRQGVEMGRPSLLRVRLVAGEPGVRVAGAAHALAV